MRNKIVEKVLLHCAKLLVTGRYHFDDFTNGNGTVVVNGRLKNGPPSDFVAISDQFNNCQIFNLSVRPPPK